MPFIDTISGSLAALSGGLIDDVQSVVLEFAQLAEDQAKATAPWGDRTGAARDGLYASVDQVGLEVQLSLNHSVDYGLWLEVIKGGQYAVIMPTLEALSSTLFERVNAKPTGGGFL